jgi:putative addiction module killer protein/probable addiction module antidote protein
MVELIRSTTFDTWLSGLRDRLAVARIAVRLDRLAAGNSGDAEPVAEGVSELRINCGPGYRVYFIRQGPVLVILLCGGDKSSQGSDNRQSKALAAEWKAYTMPEEKFARYDSADYLKTEDDIAAYLEAVMDEGGDDPAYVARALGVVARSQNMTALAREVGMSRVGLNKALSGEGNPTLSTVMKVAKALGLKVSILPGA